MCREFARKVRLYTTSLGHTNLLYLYMLFNKDLNISLNIFKTRSRGKRIECTGGATNCRANRKSCYTGKIKQKKFRIFP